MNNELKKRYGFWTAVAMVIGGVIGSGVFFKAEKVLVATGGDLKISILAWLVGGAIMVVCAYTFSLLAARYETVNGIVDYAEAALGKTYGYLVGWFMTTIYYPCLCGVLAWVSASYTAVLLGFENTQTGAEVFVIAGFYLILVFTGNFLAPMASAKFQISTTAIKIIPLIMVGIVGLISGLMNGQITENLSVMVQEGTVNSPFLTSLVATAFAYEGWIIATSINSEIKDSKKNLPKALVLGTLAIVAIYLAYFLGLVGTMPTSEFMGGGDTAVKMAFGTLFGNIGATSLVVFVVISCLGTLNCLIMGGTRGFYAIAKRNVGYAPEIFSQVDNATHMPTNSAILALMVSEICLFIWFGNFAGWWGMFLDISELPIVTMYAIYLPIYVWIMKSLKDLNFFDRFIAPTLALMGSSFMIYAAFFSHGSAVYVYLALFAVVMLIGFVARKEKN